MEMYDNEKLKLIKEKALLKGQEAELNGRFSLFQSNYVTESLNKCNEYSKAEYIYDMVSDYDEKCKIPYEIGMQIDKLASVENVFVHRTNLYLDKGSNGIPDSEALYSIMNDGLKNLGHMNAGGFVRDIPSLSLTMTQLKGLSGYINLVSSYKSNDTIIIASFPKDMINEDGYPVGDPSEIYNLDDKVPKIKPEYIIGAFLKKDEGLWDFYYRDEIVKKNQEDKGKSV